jgi:hypothetical protein
MEKSCSLNAIIRKDRVNKKGECRMFIKYTYKRKQYDIPLNLSIRPSDWNDDSKEPRRTCPYKLKIMDLIEKKKIELGGLILEYKIKNNDYPTTDELKKILSNSIEPIRTWEDYFESFIISQKKNKHIGNPTLQVYGQLKVKLKSFLEINNLDWSWQEINLRFYDEFVSFLRNNDGLVDATIGKYIKTLKTFLNYVSQTFELINPNQYSQFKTLKGDVDFTTLNAEDIELMKSAIYISSIHRYKDYNLTNDEIHMIQIMIIFCLTGMNFCDLLDIELKDFSIQEGKNETLYDDVNGETSIGLYIKKRRQKIISVATQSTPIISITHELSDAFLLSFDGRIDFYKEKRKFSHVLSYFKDENIPITTLWNLIFTLKNMKESEAKKILPSYPYLLPRMSNVIFNREIKLVLKKIGLISDVKLYKPTSINKIQELIKPKFNFISSRTGRRSYITNSLSKGIGQQFVLRATGIIKHETLRRYEKIPESVIVNQIKEKNPKPQRVKEKVDYRPLGDDFENDSDDFNDDF